MLRLTSHIWSLYSINEFTASMAKKLLSSIPAFSVFSFSMLGVITVARLCVSILLPVSPSTFEKDEAQTRKEKSISNESRWLLGSRQQVRCKTLLLFSSSAISVTYQQIGKIQCQGSFITLRGDEKPIKLVGQQWIRKFSEELLEQRCNLHGILF